MPHLRLRQFQSIKQRELPLNHKQLLLVMEQQQHSMWQLLEPERFLTNGASMDHRLRVRQVQVIRFQRFPHQTRDNTQWSFLLPVDQ